MDESVYLISRDSILIAGGVIGTLAGAIVFMLRLLVNSKDQQIKLLNEQMRRIDTEREYLRDLALGVSGNTNPRLRAPHYEYEQDQPS